MLRAIVIAISLAFTCEIASAQTYFAAVDAGVPSKLGVSDVNGAPVPAWCVGCQVVTEAEYQTYLSQMQAAGAPPPMISKDDFWARFTDAEQDALIARIMTNANVRKHFMLMPERINLNSSALSNMLDALTTAGDLAAGRKAVILAPPKPQ